MAIIGCVISHKDTKHTDKCSSNEKKQHRNNDETIEKYVFKIL
jgi:hypothetical protein